MRIYDFDRAIVRTPAKTVVNGLRAAKSPDPSYDKLQKQHHNYVTALRNAGVSVIELEPLDAFPDSVFVEDPALVFTSGAIALRPGASSREGEAQEILPTLEQHFSTVVSISNGYVDGGDILATPSKIFIGLSKRTNRQGAKELARILFDFGFRSEIVTTPSEILHFKTGCALIDDETILATGPLAATDLFSDFRVLTIPDGEDAAANSLRINDTLLVPEGFPRTTEILARHTENIIEIDVSEVAKIDAGLSCMSLRWKSAR